MDHECQRPRDGESDQSTEQTDAARFGEKLQQDGAAFCSVAERTREIGIRKAIGARRRTILLQFLLEAASLCLLGGLIALAIAYSITLILARFLPANLSLPIAALALVMALLTGLVSGFLPAWRAARMNPVDALRNE